MDFLKFIFLMNHAPGIPGDVNNTTTMLMEVYKMSNTTSTTNSQTRISQLNKLIEQRKAESKKTGSQERKLKLVTLVAHMHDLLTAEQLKQLNEQDVKVYESLMTEYTGHPGTKITVQLGDTILGLWQKYNDVPKLMEKINRQVEQNGWIIDQKSGTVQLAAVTTVVQQVAAQAKTTTKSGNPTKESSK